MKKKTGYLLSFISLVLSLFLFWGVLFFLPLSGLLWRTLLASAVGALGIATPLFLLLGKERIGRPLFAALVLLSLGLGLLLLREGSVMQLLSDLLYVKELLLSLGGWGVLLCLFLIVANVVLLPLPATLFYLAASAVYGGWLGFTLSYIGTLVGSFIAFFLGRFLGVRAVAFCIGKEKTEKYAALLHRKGKLPFVLMQLLPFFPDDVLCMVAGLSHMPLSFFSLTMLFAKPLYIALVCFSGQENGLLFSPAAPLWIVVFILFALLSLLYLWRQEEIDGALSRLFHRKK